MPNEKQTRFQIVIGASSKGVKKVIAMVKSRLKSIGSLLKNISLLTAGLGAGAIAGFSILGKRALDAIDKIGKLSRTLGISTQQLSAMKLAAELGGMSLEGFAKASKQVSKAVYDFVVRGTGEAADAFRELGITQADLRPIQNDQMEILALLADRMAGMENGATKTAVAMKLFGARGAEMMNVMAKGSDTIRQASREAEEFGLALSEDQVAAVEAANDAWTRLKSLFTGIIHQMTAALAPALQQVNDFLREKIQNSIKESGGSVKNWAATMAVSVLDMLKKMMEGLKNFAKFAGNVMDKVHGVRKLYLQYQERRAYAAAKTAREAFDEANAAFESSKKSHGNGITSFSEEKKQSRIAALLSLVEKDKAWQASKAAVNTLSPASNEQSINMSFGTMMEGLQGLLTSAQKLILNNAGVGGVGEGGAESSSAKTGNNRGMINDETLEEIIIQPTTLQRLQGRIADFFGKDIINSLTGFATEVKYLFSNLSLDVRNPIESIGNAIKNTFIRAANAIFSEIIGNMLNKITSNIFGGAFGGLLGFKDGGYVSGAGGPREDKIPAMLSDGEFVVNAASTKKFLPILRRLNAGLPAFAGGGLVSVTPQTLHPRTVSSGPAASGRGFGQNPASDGVKITQHLHFDVGLETYAGMIAQAAEPIKQQAANAVMRQLQRRL